MPEPSFNNISYSERYSIRYELGKGGMGVVYKARDKLLDKDVAIKLLKQNKSSDSIIRFQKEARACGRLSHKNILTALDFGTTEEGEPYLVLDFIEGKTLADLLKQEKRLAVNDALPIVLELVAALAYAHSLGVLHRDLKPSNIMVTQDEHSQPTIKVMDFGLAKLNTDDEQSLTGTGIVGSPKYLSPEQANSETVDERSDIYSFGCTVFELLSGQAPILGATALDTIRLKQTEDAPPLRSACPEGHIHVGMEAIVGKCLARNKNDRYKSFHEIKEDLVRFIDSGAIEINENIAAAKNEIVAQSTKKSNLKLYAALLFVTAIAAATYLNSHLQTPGPAKKFSNLQKGHALEFAWEESNCMVANDKVVFSRVDADWFRTKFEPRYGSKRMVKALDSDLSGDTLAPMTNYPVLFFDFGDSAVDDGTLAELSKFKKTQTIWVVSNNLNVTYKGIEKLANLPDLTKLYIEQSVITDRELLAISSLKRLTSITALGDGYTGEGLENLSALRKLRHVDIGPKADHELFIALSSLKGLQAIGFHFAKPGQLATSLKTLSSLPKLKMLNLVNTNFAKNDLKDLERLKSLQAFTIDTCKFDGGYAPIDDICKIESIETISLVDMDNLPEEQIIKLGSKPGLHKLILNGPYEKRTELETAILKHNPKVKVIGTRVL